MSETANKGSMTVCNTMIMAEAYMSLMEIVESLNTAYEKAENLATDFAEAYDGEAKEEVMIFLENLPIHIYKLSLFYGKMAQFVVMTLTSFVINDETMVENMGNK